MSMAELVCLVAIRPTDAEPDKREQLDEQGEPRGRARAVRVPTAAKEAAGREFVERGVLGGEYGRVGGNRDHAERGGECCHNRENEREDGVRTRARRILDPSARTRPKRVMWVDGCRRHGNSRTSRPLQDGRMSRPTSVCTDRVLRTGSIVDFDLTSIESCAHAIDGCVTYVEIRVFYIC